ncbi:MAG: hydratase, partial [Desulfitobacterium sp.]|nr:hydratase [Desulfitobacterium sp.]
NWGMLPFTWEDDPDVAFQVDDLVVISGIRESVKNGDTEVTAKLLTSAGAKEIKLQLQSLTKDERDIILHGSLINYYAAQ